MVADDDEDQFHDHSQVNHAAPIQNQIKQMKTDWAGLEAHQERKANGLRLFGKYFRTLWD